MPTLTRNKSDRYLAAVFSRSFVGGSSGSGTVSDGDKGDITITTSGTTWTVDKDIKNFFSKAKVMFLA